MSFFRNEFNSDYSSWCFVNAIWSHGCRYYMYLKSSCPALHICVTSKRYLVTRGGYMSSTSHISFTQCMRAGNPYQGKMNELKISYPGVVRPPLTHWGRDKVDAISQTTFSNAFSWMKIFEYRLKFVPKGPINNISALVQIMAWRLPGDKPLSESMMFSLPTHICVTGPQWVK